MRLMVSGNRNWKGNSCFSSNHYVICLEWVRISNWLLLTNISNKRSYFSLVLLHEDFCRISLRDWHVSNLCSWKSAADRETSSNDDPTDQRNLCCRVCVEVNAFFRFHVEPCVYNNTRYYHGDIWEVSKCQAAVCINGSVRSHFVQCSTVECKSVRSCLTVLFLRDAK